MAALIYFQNCIRMTIKMHFNVIVKVIKSILGFNVNLFMFIFWFYYYYFRVHSKHLFNLYFVFSLRTLSKAS